MKLKTNQCTFKTAGLAPKLNLKKWFLKKSPLGGDFEGQGDE